ncbi:OLC1v1034595C1 [Oldenlandia corymbosa var. corymbosa]|uniref:OLC1v1034595C1 n=1 Tax=Oldenlandia corymbosa var. corymbosa TaxID=529605 RepID=A0AAV1CS98_OLDCO|nr:OLC1v1034595C1 [Oldenlandia corymbosa var. corymbosa]
MCSSLCGKWQLDDWVLCRVWRKTGAPCPLSEDRNGLISREPAQACTRLGKQCSKKLGEERTVTLSDFPTLPFLMDFQNPCSNINVADVSSLRFEDKKISTDNPGMYSAAAVSNISFEGIKATSSVCEDNFNIEDYHGLIEMTRTLVSNTSTTIDGNSQDIGVGNIYKKNPVGPEEVEKDSKSSIVVVVPQQSESNDTNGAVSCSTRQVDKNDSISPLDQLLMSPDLYSWTWAFP